METIYRLEFNEAQQAFHLAPLTEGPGGPGWFVITDYCTDLEFWIFEAYINRVPHRRLTKSYLVQSLMELREFLINLGEYNLNIQSGGPTDGKIDPPFTFKRTTF